MTEELTEKKVTVVQLGSKIAQLQNQVDAYETLEAQVSKLTEELIEKNLTLQSLTESFDRNQSSSEVAEKIKLLDAQLSTLTVELFEKNLTVQRLSSKVSHDTVSYKNAIEKLESDVVIITKDLTDELADKKSTIQRLTDDLCQSQFNLERSLANIKRLESQISSLTKEITFEIHHD